MRLEDWVMTTAGSETGDKRVSAEFFEFVFGELRAEMSAGRSFETAARKLAVTHLPVATVAALRRRVESCCLPDASLAQSHEVSTHG